MDTRDFGLFSESAKKLNVPFNEICCLNGDEQCLFQ